jgi:hypothetical protein
LSLDYYKGTSSVTSMTAVEEYWVPVCAAAGFTTRNILTGWANGNADNRLTFERVNYGKVQHESQRTPASGDTTSRKRLQVAGALATGPAIVAILQPCGHVPHPEKEAAVLASVREFLAQWGS